MSDRTPIKVGILGCTGTVGQRFIQLLKGHQWFNIHALGASPRSAGLAYSAAVTKWLAEGDIPIAVAEMTVQECIVEGPLAECEIVFSALDSSVAHDIELTFKKHGAAVFSNARNHRMDPLVPLVVPLANPDHILLARAQREANVDSNGFIVCNANCTSTGLCQAIAPIHAVYPIKRMMVTSLQAISGAGYPGLSALDLIDNVVPYISGEEDKVETEPNKILGKLKNDGEIIEPEAIGISAMCNRVNVVDGHTVCVSMEFEPRPDQVSPGDIEALLSQWAPEAATGLPTTPETALFVKPEAFGPPQPRVDRSRGQGFTVTVGRVRECPLLDIKMVIVSHNTIVGAAGSAILNAELAVTKGLLDESEAPQPVNTQPAHAEDPKVSPAQRGNKKNDSSLGTGFHDPTPPKSSTRRMAPPGGSSSIVF